MNAPGDAACVSCGARASGGAALSAAPGAESPSQNLVLGAVVWLFLGLVGGYAYWSGNALRAYARIALWGAWVGSLTLINSVERAAGAPAPAVNVFLFSVCGLMIFLLWVFDLLHLLRKWGQRVSPVAT